MISENRYDTDDAHREKRKQISRDYHRKNTGYTQRHDSANRSGDLTTYGRYRSILIGHKEERLLCFTKRELSDLLGYAENTLIRWVKSGKLPKPVFSAKHEEERRLKTYLEEEVLAIITIISRHQKEFNGFHVDHVDTVYAIKDAILAIREKHNMNI